MPEVAEVKAPALPSNAYTELRPNEAYYPLVTSFEKPPELTVRSIVWGILLCILFSAASAYSGLKVGQVMEAAIPISILTIGLARLYQRRSTVLENVIVTSIGGVSGSVAAGAIFTLPALYILQLSPHPLQTVFICLAGACLGVLFLIPLRRYFVRDMHGKLPYPEATAITEVLVTGEKGGSQAKLLLQATAIAGVYDFFVTTFQVWKEYINFQFLPVMRTLNDRARMVFNFDATAFILGLGYVMGLRSSLILCAGGVLSNFILVPLIWFIGQHLGDASVYPATIPIAKMTAVQIYRNYVRFIGVGAIATAGIFGIIKSLKIVAGSLGIALKVFQRGEVVKPERTDRDISVVSILLGVVATAIGITVLFGTLHVGWTIVVAGLLLAMVFSFFFTSVAANAIATVARNPVSGMTMLTIIISCIVLLKFGLSGTAGMFFVMAIAGMVCTALSVSGQTITDLKTGYWLGSTPAAQEKVKFIGAIAAALTCGLMIVMLAHVYQFGEAAAGDARTVLPSPQASIMKALVEGFMSRAPVAYLLFGVGAMITIVLEMLEKPSLVFALGMYLPLELNTPALVGGFLAHFLGKRAEQKGGEAGNTIRERGVIIASGLMAGGALGGVFGAGLRLIPDRTFTLASHLFHIPAFSEDWVQTPFYGNEAVSQSISAVLFIALCFYTWYGSLRRRREQ